jgi:hypothetical protein|tara:strand:+ start:194 stop:598 length:405 start_codon:yes stop_codon:yes gene_type:complete
MSQMFEVKAEGSSNGHPMMTSMELVLYLSFRSPPRVDRRTGAYGGEATLDIRFQGPPPVYPVKFRVMGRLTKNSRSYFPHCVTYNVMAIHERLLVLTKRELTLLGEKIAEVIKTQVGCSCKAILPDLFDLTVSE